MARADHAGGIMEEISQSYLQDQIDKEHALYREAALEAARCLQRGDESTARFWRLVEALEIDPQNLPERNLTPEEWKWIAEGVDEDSYYGTEPQEPVDVPIRGLDEPTFARQYECRHGRIHTVTAPSIHLLSQRTHKCDCLQEEKND
jgi:hypothetical protein